MMDTTVLDKTDLVGAFKYLGVNVELVQYLDGNPPRVQIAYDDARVFVAHMVGIYGERDDFQRRRDEANERLATLENTKTLRFDPEQLDRIVEALSEPRARRF